MKCCKCGNEELPDYFFLKANEREGENKYICVLCVFNFLDIYVAAHEEGNIWELLKDTLSEEYYKSYKEYKTCCEYDTRYLKDNKKDRKDNVEKGIK